MKTSFTNHGHSLVHMVMLFLNIKIGTQFIQKNLPIEQKIIHNETHPKRKYIEFCKRFQKKLINSIVNQNAFVDLFAAYWTFVDPIATELTGAMAAQENHILQTIHTNRASGLLFHILQLLLQFDHFAMTDRILLTVIHNLRLRSVIRRRCSGVDGAHYWIARINFWILSRRDIQIRRSNSAGNWTGRSRPISAAAS